jgi:hypothetical protein
MRAQLARWIVVAAAAIGKVRARMSERVHQQPIAPIPCRHDIWYGCNCDDCRARRIARHYRLVNERLNLVRNIARTETGLIEGPVVWVGGIRVEKQPGALERARRLRATNHRRIAQLRVLDAKLARDRQLWDRDGRALGNTRASADLARKLMKLGGAA